MKQYTIVQQNNAAVTVILVRAVDYDAGYWLLRCDCVTLPSSPTGQNSRRFAGALEVPAGEMITTVCRHKTGKRVPSCNGMSAVAYGNAVLKAI